MKIEKSKLKLKKFSKKKYRKHSYNNYKELLKFFSFKQIYKQYLKKPNFIFKLFFLYYKYIQKQKNVNIFKNYFALLVPVPLIT